MIKTIIVIAQEKQKQYSLRSPVLYKFPFLAHSPLPQFGVVGKRLKLKASGRKSCHEYSVTDVYQTPKESGRTGLEKEKL
jgi:hypothetical protein